MAKKSVGKVQGRAGKKRAEVIIPMKTEKGSYTFAKFIVPSEEVSKLIASKTA